ncbi:hypothetical protein KAW64_03690, partial [bacterium]|nr:hypothetical protein [bacterium]
MRAIVVGVSVVILALGVVPAFGSGSHECDFEGAPPADRAGGERTGTCPQYWTTAEPDSFRWFDVGGYSTWIDMDLDILIDNRFNATSFAGEVTDAEMNALLHALDEDYDNTFGWER